MAPFAQMRKNIDEIQHGSRSTQTSIDIASHNVFTIKKEFNKLRNDKLLSLHGTKNGESTISKLTLLVTKVGSI